MRVTPRQGPPAAGCRLPTLPGVVALVVLVSVSAAAGEPWVGATEIPPASSNEWVAAGASADKYTDRATEAATVLDEVMGTAESAIPEWLLEEAHCVAVIPGVVKVGFVFGGRYGRGLVSCRVGDGWSRPSFIAITGGSFGLQIGGQATDFILVFANRRAAERLTENKFTLGGDASVAAGPVGRTASAGTDIKLQTEIYSYSRSRGLFAGLSLEGSTLYTDDEANEDVYGDGADPEGLLFTGGGGIPAGVSRFVEALARHAPEGG